MKERHCPICNWEWTTKSEPLDDDSTCFLCRPKIAAIIATEREACAKMLEEVAYQEHNFCQNSVEERTLLNAAAAIRARK